MARVILLVGPSAVGKSELENAIVKRYAVSKLHIYTTRPQRLGEEIKQGIVFTSIDLLLGHGMIPYAVIKDNYGYAINKYEIEGDVILSVISNQTAYKLKQTLQGLGHDIFIIYLNSNSEERYQQLLQRAYESSDIKKAKIDVLNRIDYEINDIEYINLDPNIVYENYDYNIDVIPILTSLEDRCGIQKRLNEES